MNDQDAIELIQKIMKDANQDMAEYWVSCGDRVTVKYDGAFVVSKILMKGEIESKLNDQKVWGLFCLVGINNGSIYAEPVPVMSEGSVDLRRLVAPHVTVTYRKTRGNTRFYDAVLLRDDHQFTIAVTAR